MRKEKKSGKRKLRTIPREGTIVALSLPSGISYSKRAAFFRQLYGYNDHSQYGKYHYRREGILDRIGYVPFCRGVFIIPKNALPELKQFINGKAAVTTRTVKLTAQDKKLLKG